MNELEVLPLPPHIRLYLNQERFLGDEILQKMGVGYVEKSGNPWIVFPVLSPEGEQIGYKLKGMPGAEVKAKNWPAGVRITPYAAHLIQEMNADRIFICEGEPDCLLLLQAGLSAITSTGGAGAFKSTWLDYIPEGKEVVLIFDADPAGENGRKKLEEMIHEKRKDLSISHVRFEGYGEKGYDITDLWAECLPKGDNPLDVLLSLIESEETGDGIEMDSIPDPEHYMRPIPVVEKPELPILIDDWRKIIQKQFPELAQSAEVCLSVVAQLLIHTIRNPFALVLVDSAASGKTITLNFFDGIKEFTYSSDNFTPASLVSQAAHKKAKDLDSIDMLPRIRWKTLIVREMATIFSEKEEDLRHKLGILTRVLDGEGFTVDSGTHGQRGYQGDYLFMFLGASTPLPIRVWKVMGDFGHRLFFLSLNTKEQNVEDGVAQLEDLDYKAREYLCKRVTHAFLRTLWNEHPSGVTWDKDRDDRQAYLWLARFSNFLARYRGGIKIYDSEKEHGDQFSYTVPEFEKPRRILQCLYNLTCGHALAAGRTHMEMGDLMPALRIMIDSAQNPRPLLLKILLRNNGILNSKGLSIEMGSMEVTAKKEMKKFMALKICKEIPVPEGVVIDEDDQVFSLYGQSQEEKKTIAMQLNKEFDWLIGKKFLDMITTFGINL